MKRQRTEQTSGSNAQGAAPDAASETMFMPSRDSNATAFSIILGALDNIQATMAAMQSTIQKEVADIQATVSAVQKEVADIKKTQRHLLNEVRGLQNDKKKFYTRLEDIPVEVIVQIFSWIPLQSVFRYRRLSKTINQCLLTTEFAKLNVQTADFLNGLENGMNLTWIHLPERYQSVVASAMSGQLKKVVKKKKRLETKALPESITRLTAVEEIELPFCKLTGSIPNGMSALQNLTHLDLSHNSLMGPLPSSFNLLVALESLDLSNNQLSGDFPALPNLNALHVIVIDGNCFTGPIPTVFGPQLRVLSASRNLFSFIPAAIGELTNLESLNIEENSFAHEIPAGIWNLTNLTFLLMSNCQLSGSLAGVGNLLQLEWLDASNNRFSGELPSREIRSLESLHGLHLIGNQFLGGEILDLTGGIWNQCVWILTFK
ncbi:hypothetical protein HDU77_007450 [Chytriomyces hyalinus]|nr:hypothetical protein HDU77_007450 [Chytriomyces hyalinus]